MKKVSLEDMIREYHEILEAQETSRINKLINKLEKDHKMNKNDKNREKKAIMARERQQREEYEAMGPEERQHLRDMAETVIAQCLAGEEVRFWLEDEPKHLMTMVYDVQMERAEPGVWFDYISPLHEFSFETRRHEKVYQRFPVPMQKAVDLTRKHHPWCFASQGDLDAKRAAPWTGPLT